MAKIEHGKRVRVWGHSSATNGRLGRVIGSVDTYSKRGKYQNKLIIVQLEAENRDDMIDRVDALSLPHATAFEQRFLEEWHEDDATAARTFGLKYDLAEAKP